MGIWYSAAAAGHVGILKIIIAVLLEDNSAKALPRHDAGGWYLDAQHAAGGIDIKLIAFRHVGGGNHVDRLGSFKGGRWRYGDGIGNGRCNVLLFNGIDLHHLRLYFVNGVDGNLGFCFFFSNSHGRIDDMRCSR